MNILFVFTLGATIINILVILTNIGSDSVVTIPKYDWISFTRWYVFYPSFFYQVWWWSEYFELLS